MGQAPPWPGELLTFGSTTLFVRKTAAIPPENAQMALMIHGLGGQSTNWTDLMGILSGGLCAWAPDLPGFGRSPAAIDGDYSLDAHVGSVAVVVESIGTPVHVFGNSLGGAAAVRLAATRPELVRSLVLTSPALPDLRPRRDTLGVPAVAAPGIGEYLWRRLTKLPVDRQVQAMLELNFGNPSRVTELRRQEAAAEYRRRFELDYAGEALSKTARGLLRAYFDPRDTGLWRQASRLHCPTLVMYGGRDRLVDPRKARRAAATIPRAEVHMLPRVGHVAQMEDPELVARFTKSFLDRIADH